MMTNPLRSCLVLLAALLTGCNPSSDSKSYPGKTLTLVCPWAAGGGTDRLARFMADALQQSLGQSVIVVNQVGGSGAAGHQKGALADPDGYTLTMATFELSTMHWMGISTVTYTNFTPLMQLNADAAALLVKSDAPWPDLTSFLAHIRANPGQVTMSGTATGGAWDLARAGFLLAAELPVESVRWIPKKGSAPSIVELLGGHIDAVCCSVPEAAAQIDSGELRVLAVMAPERLAEYPDIPTVREQGVAWDAVGWRGLVLPKDTPADIVATLEAHCQRIVDGEAFRTFMKQNGFVPVVRGGKAFETFLAEQDRQWQPVIEKTGYAK